MLRTRSFIFLMNFFTMASFAEQKYTVENQHATVFLHGAEITGAAHINIPKGETEILFTNVAGNILKQSVSVGIDNNVLILSTSAQNNYLNADELSPRASAIKDSLELLKESVAVIQDKKMVIDEQIAVLRENRKISGDKALQVSELQKMLELVNNKMNSLLAEKHEQDKKTEKLNERIALLQRQFDEEKKKAQPGGQLLVKVYSEKAVQANVSVSYVIQDAGWTPAYDLRVAKINTPVQLFYKANVYQNSGIKWDDIRISLSTGNPNEGAEAPSMNPWYLSFYAPVLSYETSSSKSYKTEDMRLGTEEKYLSYNAASAAPSIPQASLNNYVRVDNSGVNTSFDIDIPYTIPSDGQQHLVAIKDVELPATYRYFAVPKLDKDAFLQARITNWEDLNLLPAQTNIFYEGTYVGQGFIDMHHVKDTMDISLGRDKKIIIQREQNKNYRAAKFIGSNVRKSYQFTVSVRNTRQSAISIVLLDQFPVSNDKDIEIEDAKAENATINKSDGSITWKLNIAPNETHKEQLSYTVKYPKDKQVINLY